MWSEIYHMKIMFGKNKNLNISVRDTAQESVYALGSSLINDVVNQT